MALHDGLPPEDGKLEMYASGLMTLLKKVTDFNTFMTAYPEVHPEVENAQADLLDLRRKVGVGVDHTIIQFFFDIESYLCSRDRCVLAGIDVEVTLGTLPVSNFRRAKKFADVTNVCTPTRVAQMFDNLGGGTETCKLADANIIMDMVEISSREGVKDFHFHTFSRAKMSYTICHTPGVRPGL